jgi:hypothetical protein
MQMIIPIIENTKENSYIKIVTCLITQTHNK